MGASPQCENEAVRKAVLARQVSKAGKDQSRLSEVTY